MADQFDKAVAAYREAIRERNALGRELESAKSAYVDADSRHDQAYMKADRLGYELLAAARINTVEVP